MKEIPAALEPAANNARSKSVRKRVESVVMMCQGRCVPRANNSLSTPVAQRKAMLPAAHINAAIEMIVNQEGAAGGAILAPLAVVNSSVLVVVIRDADRAELAGEHSLIRSSRDCLVNNYYLWRSMS